MFSIPDVHSVEMTLIQDQHQTLYPRNIVKICRKSWIYVRESQEKKYLEKKLWVKKSQFSEVLGQNVFENKVLSFNFLGLFSENKVSGNEISGIKVLKKKVLNLGNMRSIPRCFHKKDFFLCICIFNRAKGV